MNVKRRPAQVRLDEVAEAAVDVVLFSKNTSKSGHPVEHFLGCRADVVDGEERRRFDDVERILHSLGIGWPTACAVVGPARRSLTSLDLARDVIDPLSTSVRAVRPLSIWIV